MQAAPQQQLSPELQAKQLQANIDNLHWSQKQSELSQAFNQQQATQHMAIEHQQFMVDHLATPIAAVVVMVVIAFLVSYCFRSSLAADIEKNRDDNASDVRRAQEILDKHEAGA
jgi:hypothetical protein